MIVKQPKINQRVWCVDFPVGKAMFKPRPLLQEGQGWQLDWYQNGF